MKYKLDWVRAYRRSSGLSPIDSQNAISANAKKRQSLCRVIEGENGGLSSVRDSESKDEWYGYDQAREAKSAPKIRVYGNQRWNCCNILLAIFLTTSMLFFTPCQAVNNMCIVKGNIPLPICSRMNSQQMAVEYGHTARFCCGLGWSIIDPYAYRTRVSDLQILIDDEVIAASQSERCGKNTIELPMKDLAPGKYRFTCRLKLGRSLMQYEVLKQYQIIIDSKPAKPRNFKCISYNLEKIVCTWEPAPYYVPTQFALQFQSQGSGLATSGSSFTCSVSKTEPGSEQHSCTWVASTESPHKLNDEYYTLTLNAENVFGNESFIYKYHHWANVIPSKPDSLTVLNTTSSSAMLRWTIPSALREFPPGLHYRVSYQNPHNDDDNWIAMNITDVANASEVYCDLTHLPSPNTTYKVRVSMKNSLADGEETWGPFSQVTFQTAMEPPPPPQKTIIGTFEIAEHGSHRDVYIYWPDIRQEVENGKYFTYRIIRVTENGRRLDLQPDEITEKYALFKNISHGDWKFDIEITATGADGQTIYKATVHVPIETNPLGPSSNAASGSIRIANKGDKRDVFIYWPSIPPESSKGQILTYRVVRVEENGLELDLQPDEVTNTYAYFKGISYGDWKFKIDATDANGRIVYQAEASVPSGTKRPDPSPETVAGNFEIHGDSDDRIVYIYWPSLRQTSRSGQNLTYRLLAVKENGRTLDIQPDEITGTYAMFRKISSGDWKFDVGIFDANDQIIHKATVHVPSNAETLPKPVVHTKIAFGHGIYELSWNKLNNPDITNYTIFWCENGQNRPYHCSGKLDWTDVPGNLSTFNVTVPDPEKIYQFAIAANTAQSSSGMARFPGTTIASNDVGKLRSLVISDIESDQVRVAWQLDYPGRMGDIKGYVIYCCTIQSAYSCGNSRLQNTIRGDRRITSDILGSLKPNTTYMLTMTVVFETGEGPHSDPLHFTTLEADVSPVLTSTTPADIQPEASTVSPETYTAATIDQSLSDLKNFIEKSWTQHNEDIDRKLNRIGDLETAIINVAAKVSNLTSTVSTLVNKFDSLSKENGQLRENLMDCRNQQRYDTLENH